MVDTKSNYKQLLWLEYIKKGIYSVYSTFCRFPLTILILLSLAIITIYRIEVPFEKIKDFEELLNRVMAVLFFGVPLSLGINLLFERFAKSNYRLVKLGIYFIEIGLLYLYFLILLPNMEMVPMVRLVILGIALSLAFLFIPFLLKKVNFEIYIIKIANRLITTAFFSIVLALGFIAILFAIKSLLYSQMDSNYYAYVWIIAGLIFAPLYFLYGLPKQEDEFSLDNYNKIIQVLLLYIVMPIVSIYTVVLYLYFAKILVTQVWPEGIVSYLVLSYTAVSILTIFLITPLKGKNKWVRIFISLYNKLIFPLLAIMFISISIRISDYGFTENRYLILIVGIWAALAMIFLNINKGKNNIILPISLAIVAFLAVCGPWSAFSVSISSQNQRFNTILEKYDMIEKGMIVKNSVDIDGVDQREIVEILNYFDRSHEFTDLENLPLDFTFNYMEEVFGFSEDVLDNDKYDFFNYVRDRNKPIDVKGYDILINFESYNNYEKDFSNEMVDSQNRNIDLSITDNYLISLILDGNKIYEYELDSYIDSLIKKYGHKYEEIIPAELIMLDSNEKVDIKLVFESINSPINNNDIENKDFEMKILVKIK